MAKYTGIGKPGLLPFNINKTIKHCFVNWNKADMKSNKYSIKILKIRNVALGTNWKVEELKWLENNSKSCSCGSVVEHCVSNAKVVGSIPSEHMYWQKILYV